jgi:hypothetical protein
MFDRITSALASPMLEYLCYAVQAIMLRIRTEAAAEAQKRRDCFFLYEVNVPNSLLCAN